MEEKEKTEFLSSVEEKASNAVREELKTFRDKMNEYATAKDLEKKFDILEDQVKSIGGSDLKKSIDELKEDVQNTVLTMKKIEEEMKTNNKVGVSFDRQLKDSLEKNADNLKLFKSKNTKDVSSIITLKDVTSIRSDVSGDTVAHRVPGIGEIQRRRTFMRELFTPGKISPNNHGVIRYVDQNALVTGATTISEASAYPVTSSLNWIERTINVEKVGDSIKISREMMDDVDFVETQIRRLLEKNINLKIDEQLLTGDGNTPNLKGLQTSATAFSLNSVFNTSVVSPNTWDVMLIVAAQIASGTGYNVNGVLVNDLDKAAMSLVKDALGNYILPPFSVQTASGIQSVEGVRVVGNSGITANTMYVGDFSAGTVFSSEELTFEFGYENDDFTKNLVTLIGLERLALLIRVVDAGAFNYVSSISDVKTAITKSTE